MTGIRDIYDFNMRFGRFLENKFLKKYGWIPEQRTNPRRGIRFKIRERYIHVYSFLEHNSRMCIRVETDVSLNKNQLEKILREKISETKLDEISRYLSKREVHSNEIKAYISARVKKTRKIDERDKRILNEEVWSYMVMPVIRYFREDVFT